MATTLSRFEWRRNTATAWTTSNEVLLSGEPGFETDTGRFKVGDGTTTWAGLRYSDALAGQDTNAKDPLFGAKGDGVTDDTAALQAFINYIVVNGRAGFIPAGTYKITSRLNFPCRPSWSIRGAHRGSTTIRQATDNTPIFYLGSDTASLMHTYRISDLNFDYSNVQPATNTNAVPIWFNTMAFEGVHRDLTFSRGCYAYKVTAGVGGPWGTTFDDIVFSSGLTGGAMDWVGAVNAVPNNRFGRFFVDCQNMVGPVFTIRGYNFIIDTIEFIAANQGATLLSFASGTMVTIGTIKLENGAYTTGSKNLIEHFGNGWLSIDALTIGGNSMVLTPPIGNVYAISHQAGNGWVQVKYINASATAMSGGVYLLGAAGKIRADHVVRTGGWVLQNQGGTPHADNIIVTNQVTGQPSPDRGDADYSITQGDPNVIMYETPLTAPRTVQLPFGNNNFTGLWYEVISRGAVNGTNTITIKSSGNTFATITTDKTRLRFHWRRGGQANAALGWYVSDKSTLP